MSPPIELDPLEARVLGVLVEKDLTTPEQYPLSINALNAGCNQKSNRDPVLELSEAEVRLTIDALRGKGLAGASHPSGSRVERYHHSVRETWGVHAVSLAILTELLLRGPQSIGELKTRCARMTPVESKDTIVHALEKLAGREFVRETPAPTGSRAPRWEQLLSASVPVSEPVSEPVSVPVPDNTPNRLAKLEAEVAQLRHNLKNLAAKLGEELDD